MAKETIKNPANPTVPTQAGVTYSRLRLEDLATIARQILTLRDVEMPDDLSDLFPLIEVALNNFDKVRNPETTKSSTVISNEYIALLKKRYIALGGYITGALGGGVAEEEAAAAKFSPKYDNLTNVFTKKSATVGNVSKVLEGINKVDTKYLEIIHASACVASMLTIVADYDATFGDKVDTKTSEKSTVKNAKAELISLLQDFKVSLDFHQRPRRHAAEALTVRSNQIFTDFAAALKVSEAARKKAQAEAERRKKAEEEAKKADQAAKA